MELVTQSHSMSEALGVINANLQELGSSVTVSNTDAATVCAALNDVFDGYDDMIQLTSSMSGSEFAAAVNGNFATAAGGEAIRIKLLHVSDTHGETAMFDAMLDVMGQEDSDIDFAVITGDMTKYVAEVYTDATKTAINGFKSLGDKLLMCPGNHDIYDNHHSGYGDGKKNQVSETAWLKSCLGNNVTWGDANNIGGYWHKDVTKDGVTLRIISIDQYCIGSTVYSGDNRQYVVYSQEEVDWLLDLLYNTPSSYYIIIMLHEPAIQSPNGTSEDTAATGMAASNIFVSELLSAFGIRFTDVPSFNLLPKIMRAYMHQENLSFTYDNRANMGGHGTLTVAKDFRNRTPATFLCYIGGHMHEDICGYIPNDDWNDQLMLHVTAGDSAVWQSTQDDLLWNFTTGSYGWDVHADRYAMSEPSYRINEVTFNFTNKTIKVKRIGNKTTALYNSTNGSARPHGGRVRDEITFPFVKEGGTT